MSKYILASFILLFLLGMKILDTNEEDKLNMKLEFNAGKYDSFGIPIQYDGIGRSYCFKKEYQYNDTIAGYDIMMKRMSDTDTILISGGNGKSFFEGKLVKLPKPQVFYQKSFDPNTYAIGEIIIHERFDFIKTGDWVYKEGNKTQMVSFNTKVKIGEPPCKRTRNK